MTIYHIDLDKMTVAMTDNNGKYHEPWKYSRDDMIKELLKITMEVMGDE